MLVSIIIPLYNAEAYIARALTSTFRQGIPAGQLEVIVIDDGSTDQSLAMARAVSEAHPEVTIISRKNRGVSCSRNEGVAMAQGRYIVFLDADDWLVEGVLPAALARMERDTLDMLCLRSMLMDGEPPRRVDPYWCDRIYARINETTIYEGKELINKALVPMVWAYMYRRDLFVQHALEMAPIRHEDEEFIPRVLYYAKRVGFFDREFYVYFRNPNSYMCSSQSDFMGNMVPAMERLTRFAEQIEAAGDLEGARYIRLRVGWRTALFCKHEVRRQAGDPLEAIRRFREVGVIPLTFADRRLRNWLINHHPRLFVAYYRYISRK